MARILLGRAARLPENRMRGTVPVFNLPDSFPRFVKLTFLAIPAHNLAHGVTFEFKIRKRNKIRRSKIRAVDSIPLDSRVLAIASVDAFGVFFGDVGGT